jgi:hypothetical protein
MRATGCAHRVFLYLITQVIVSSNWFCSSSLCNILFSNVTFFFHLSSLFKSWHNCYGKRYSHTQPTSWMFTPNRHTHLISKSYENSTWPKSFTKRTIRQIVDSIKKTCKRWLKYFDTLALRGIDLDSSVERIKMIMCLFKYTNRLSICRRY